MDWQIGLTLVVIGLTLVAFIREWAAPDVLALSILCLVVALGLVRWEAGMTEVFKNEAPLTIAALFVIGGALERSGAVDHIGRLLRTGCPETCAGRFSPSRLSAFFSAWMNNTAIVAILLPVTLGFARSKDIAASRLLMPLSYCSILGGCCTLIGTSTNLLVNGALRDSSMTPMTMFELAPIGIPLAIAGIGYLVDFRPEADPRAVIDHRQPGNRHAHHAAPPPPDRRQLADHRQAGCSKPRWATAPRASTSWRSAATAHA